MYVSKSDCEDDHENCHHSLIYALVRGFSAVLILYQFQDVILLVPY